MSADKNLKISAEDDADLEAMAAAFKAPKGFIAGILLRYGMRHREQAILEWREEGELRLRQRGKVLPLDRDRRRGS